MPRKQRFPKDAIDLYMIDSNGKETNITSFDMIRHNSDTDVAGEACLSLLEWANYLLEPNAGIDKNDDSQLDNDNDLKRPMLSYKITDDEINWKKETDTNTTDRDAIASVTEEDKLWNKNDFSVENKTAAALRNHIAEALDLSHSRYRNLKRVNKTQQDEKDIIERGMLSIMQMHSNATGTAEAKSWKNTYYDISALYHEELNSNKLTDSVMIEAPQEPIHATADSDVDDNDDDSDDDDETVSHTINHRERYSLFEDEEDSDVPETQNTLGKKSGMETIAGIGSQDAAATDKETNESEKATINDVGNESDHESATTTKSGAKGNKKRPAGANFQGNKGKKKKGTKRN